MRTLATEVRLRRLVRQHSLLVDRLAASPGDPEACAAAARRLRGLLDDVRAAWTADLSVAASEHQGELGLLNGHVRRSLRALEAAVVELERPGSQVAWLAERFRATAIPLLLFLRGLEETPAELLGLAPAPSLVRSA